MTGQIALDEERENGFMSLFNNSQRRCRRKGLSNIFEGLEEEERISFQNRLMTSSSPSSTIDENGEVITCTAMDTTPAVTPDSNCCHPRKDAADHSDESDRLSGLIEEESSSPSVSMETARPSCLVGLKSSSSNSTSSSSTSPSSMSSQTSSSSSASYFSSSSFSGESKMQACSPDDSTTTRGFTASPSSSTSSMCYITFSRVRRNALHDLFETLTQDDLEKLKNLYQTAVTTAYSLKPFSEQTQSPIRGFHEYVKKLAEELNIGEPTMKLIVDGLLQPINYDLRDKYEKPLFRTEITSLKDLTNGQKLSGRVSNVTHFGAFVDIGVGIDGLVHVSQMNPDVLRQNNRTKLELGDRIEKGSFSLNNFVMSLSANSKNHRFQVLCLNLSDAATLQMDGRRQSYKQKPRCSSLSRALSGTCLDISSLQQVKEMICCTHGQVTSGNTQQRQTRNVLLEDGNKMSSVPISTETENVYYFPHNKQHHYLNDIELSNEIFKDVDLRFGCPTKTSLLRSRQRAASTTALSKQLKAQILKIQLKTPAFQKAIYSERVRPTSARGDNSYHGFLTGGRYNWAHFVDGKCRTDLGLCIPRSNPNRSFFVAKMNKKEKKRERADLGCCSHKIQTDEYEEKKREKQISQYLIRKESLQLIVQPQPLSAVSTRTFKVRDSDLEGPRQDPPPTPILISTNPATKTRKLTGVKTTIMVPFKENSKVGLDDDGQNIEENTLS